jgi:aminoglycoside 6'-N-acetyltransferase
VLVGQVMTETIIIPYRFRSIVDADLPMMEQWLKAPEVARWWGDPAEQLVLLKKDLDNPSHAWPQVHLQSLPAATQVIDAFIGKPEMLGRGHGSAFLRLLASSFIRLVAIDPDAGNLRARRAFARAGFSEDAVVEATQGMVVVMVFGGDAP